MIMRPNNIAGKQPPPAPNLPAGQKLQQKIKKNKNKREKMSPCLKWRVRGRKRKRWNENEMKNFVENEGN